MIFKTKEGYELSTPVRVSETIHFLSEEDSKKILSQKICSPIKEKTVLFNKNGRPFKFSNLSAAEKEYYLSEVNIDINTSISISSSTEQQKGNTWLMHRKKRITCSVARPFITYINNKNPDWDRKIENHLSNKFQGSASTAHGIQSEWRGREAYSVHTGLKVYQSGLLVNPNIPWLGYSPDGIIIDQKIIEIKCPVEGKKMSIDNVILNLKYIDKNVDGDLILKENHSYFTQVQLGMFVTGLNSCDFILYATFDKSVKIISVSYDREYVVKIIPSLMFVYFNYILKRLVDKNLSTKDSNKTKSITETNRRALNDLTNK